MPKGRLRNLRPRLETMRSAIPTEQSTEKNERDAWYTSDRWKAIRRKVLPPNAICPICETSKATVVDHLVGHDDYWAEEAAFCLGISVAPTWQERFWLGPFLPMCWSCHSRKTAQEQNGYLLNWMQDNWSKLLILNVNYK